MPHTVRKRSGKKPYKIVSKTTGKVKGSSSSKTKAKQSAAIRDRKARDSKTITGKSRGWRTKPQR